MYCNVCGTNNASDSKYCRECGTKIHTHVLQAVAPSSEELSTVSDPVNRERLAKLLDMAFWHNQAGNLDAAVLACNAALAINPDSTTAHSLLGSIYEKKGNDEQAIAHLEAVLALNPNSVADETKLKQLRQGIHVKPVPPPAISRWLPPALANLSVLGVREKIEAVAIDGADGPTARVVSSSNSKPLIASLGVGVVVLGIGLLAIHPTVRTRPSVTRSEYQASLESKSSQTTAKPNSAQSNLMAGLDPRQNASSMGPSVLSPPLVLLPSKGAKSSLAPSDPFSPHPTASASTEKAHKGIPVLSLPKNGSRVVSSGVPGVLPPLTTTPLEPMPIDNTGIISPAPVTVTPIRASVASMPSHVVVVSQLGNNQANNTAQTNYPAPTVSEVSQSAPIPRPVASHINITVDKVRDGDQISTPISSPSTPNRESGGADAADQYQQSALSLQQDGHYSQAVESYQKAIRLYKSQIASGRNTETAQRGLHACQTGLQICQQSQP